MAPESEQSYINTIRASSRRYPDLNFFLAFLRTCGPLLGRAAVLEFSASRVKKKEFRTPDDLIEYFHSSAAARGQPQNRLFLLEDISPEYIEAFGTYFGLDPFLFAAQECVTHWTHTRHAFGMPRRLPSMPKPDLFYTLRYYEALKFVDPLPDLLHRDVHIAANVWRKLEKGRPSPAGEDPDGVFLLRRNASFWIREMEQGGWDALILVDPPVGTHSRASKSRSSQRFSCSPYQQGYVDFSPWSIATATQSAARNAQGPPRTSVFDDIVYYWTSVASVDQIREAQRDGAKSAVFLKKIAASNWLVVLEYIWARLSELEMTLRHFEDKQGPRPILLSQLKETLIGVNLLRRRISWYSDEMQASMQSLGISLDSPSPLDATQPSPEDRQDFLFVVARLRTCEVKLESLAPIVTGMLSIHQGELSLLDVERSGKEAKLVSKLTLLGLVFIPLSYSASLLSMGGDFLPTGPRFWLYFAVAIPMLALVLILAYLLRSTSIPFLLDLSPRERRR